MSDLALFFFSVFFTKHERRNCAAPNCARYFPDSVRIRFPWEAFLEDSSKWSECQDFPVSRMQMCNIFSDVYARLGFGMLKTFIVRRFVRLRLYRK